jgi:hypothetical protein
VLRESNFHSYSLVSCLHVVSNLIHISLRLPPNSQFADYFSCNILPGKITLSSDLRNVTLAASILSFSHFLITSSTRKHKLGSAVPLRRPSHNTQKVSSHFIFRSFFIYSLQPII